MTVNNLGRYQIQQELYSDKTGTYYRAYDPALAHKVTIKTLSEQLTYNKEFIEKYSHKVKVISKLHHPNILRIYAFQQQDNNYYSVAEYFPSKSLKELISGEKLEINQALRYFSMIAKGIDYSHGYGILHLNIAPENIFISPDNQIVKVANFELGWMETLQLDTTFDKVPDIFYYFSPEQFSKVSLTQSSDIYSLGVLFYQMLTGVLPFSVNGGSAAGGHSETLEELKRKHLEHQPSSPQNYNPDIPENVSKAVLKALHKDPKERHLNIREFLSQLATPELSGEVFQINISPTQANWHQNKAQELIRTGQLESARTYLEKAIQFDPYNSSRHYNLAQIYCRINQTELAIESFKKAINLQPDNFSFRFHLANLFYQSNKLESAINEYLITIALKPKDIESYHFLGICYFKLGNLDEAEKSWKKLSEFHPNLAEAVYNLGVINYLKQNKENARTLWEKAVQINPGFALSWYNLGILELEKGQTEQALKSWQKTLEIDPNFTEALYILGNLWYLKGDLKKATEQWKKAVNSNSKFWAAYYNLGVSSYKAGDYFSACSFWQKVITLNPDYPNVYRKLALVYQYKLNNPEKAEASWEKVIQINPEDQSAYYNLGEMYLKSGKLDLALSTWEKVLQSRLIDSWQFYHNLGVLYYKKNNIDLAKDCWITALALRLFKWEKEYVRT